MWWTELYISLPKCFYIWIIGRFPSHKSNVQIHTRVCPDHIWMLYNNILCIMKYENMCTFFVLYNMYNVHVISRDVYMCIVYRIIYTSPEWYSWRRCNLPDAVSSVCRRSKWNLSYILTYYLLAYSTDI